MPPPPNFLPRLEALRGLAALSVAIHHSVYFFRFDASSARPVRILEALFYGHGAVLCFFVLSGYVLGQSLRRERAITPISYANYVLRRCFRILPAFVVSTVVIFLVYAFTGLWKTESPAASAKYLSKYAFAPTLDVLLADLAFLKFQINSVTWTLVPELVCSILLPILHLTARAGKILTGVVLAILLGGSAVVSSTTIPVVAALGYGWVFFVGYLLFLPLPFLRRTGENFPFAVVALTGLAALVCVSVPHFGHSELLFTAGVAVIIKLIVEFPTARLFFFLDLAPVRFLGKVSYSFYLVHYPIAFALAGAFFAHVPAPLLIAHTALAGLALAALSSLAALPVAFLMYHGVELPFIALGKRLRWKSREPLGALGAPVQENSYENPHHRRGRIHRFEPGGSASQGRTRGHRPR